jgi:signal peptidase I
LTSSRYESLRYILFGSKPRRTLIRTAAIVVISAVVFGFVLLPVRGEGLSMEPTLRDGQLVFVNTLAYWRSAPQRGDIVALSLAGRRVMYIKRIVGTPGDRVRIAGGAVYVNGVPLDEPYVTQRGAWNIGEVALDADEYLLIGDNRAMSIRQHDFGTARRDRIVGRVIRW